MIWKLLQVGREEEAGPLDVLDASLDAPAAAQSEAAAAAAEAPAAAAEEAGENGEEAAPVTEKKGWQLTPEGDAAILQGQSQMALCAPFKCGSEHKASPFRLLALSTPFLSAL